MKTNQFNYYSATIGRLIIIVPKIFKLSAILVSYVTYAGFYYFFTNLLLQKERSKPGFLMPSAFKVGKKRGLLPVKPRRGERLTQT